MKIYEPRIIVALDYKNEEDALRFVELVNPSLCKLKVGKELFTHTGPNFVSNLIKRGFDVFLDLKFYDIPSTVSKAVAAADDMGVWMTDIHASGGSKMMEEAKNTLDKNNSKMLIIAVTVLTSLSRSDLSEVGVSFSPEQQVSKLASLAKKYKAEIPFLRPESISKDQSSSFKLMKHAIDYYKKNKEELISRLPVIQENKTYEYINRAFIDYDFQGNLPITYKT